MLTMAGSNQANPNTGSCVPVDFDDIAISTTGYIGPVSGSGMAVCGDTLCNGNENCLSCPGDCGQCCGNGNCEPQYGEDCQICSIDCSISSGEVCCSGVIYSGNCCVGTDCTAPDTCINNMCSSSTQCEQDNDSDGYGVGPSCLGPDCADNNPNLYQTISCIYDGTTCGQFSLCQLTCPTLPAEICTNSQDDDCDNLIDCQDPDCFQDPTCQAQQQDQFIFHDSIIQGANIHSGDPMAVSTANPFQGTSNLEIAGQGSWSNCRIENLNLDMTSIDWQNTYLELTMNSPVALGYISVNIWGDGIQAAEQVFSLSGSGNYETIQININDFSPTQTGFGSSLTQFMVGGDFGSSTIYLDEIKIVGPGSYHPADTNEDGEIDITELIDYVDDWKTGTATLQNVMGAIVEWKG